MAKRVVGRRYYSKAYQLSDEGKYRQSDKSTGKHRHLTQVLLLMHRLLGLKGSQEPSYFQKTRVPFPASFLNVSKLPTPSDPMPSSDLQSHTCTHLDTRVKRKLLFLKLRAHRDTIAPAIGLCVPLAKVCFFSYVFRICTCISSDTTCSYKNYPERKSGNFKSSAKVGHVGSSW